MEQMKRVIVDMGILRHKEVFIIIAIVGVLLCALPQLLSSNQEEDVRPASAEAVTAKREADSYQKLCEETLVTILEGTQGIGRVLVTVTVKSGQEDIIEGVVVIAEGGDNDDIRKDITEIVQALFDIDAHKIKVVKMKL